ncbi:GAP family protein [Streptomyces sp. R11]|uniref:GAP family protein n=1 Tax=Streptomyces sp. R11 TaxID=3238625 RepID=A0AB39NAH5_9ACTN
MGSPMVVDLLLIALAITLDPLPLMAFVLVVASGKGVRTGLAFIAGWMACFAAVIALVLTLTGGQPPAPRSPPSTANLAAKLLIGVSLIGYGLHRHRHRYRHRRPVHDRTSNATPDAAASSRGKSSSFLTTRMDRGAVWPAAGLAVLLQPWGLVAAGAVTVVDADTSHSTTWVELIAFCIVASASLLAAELYAVLRPASAQRRLLGMRTWMADHSQQAIVLGSVAIGLWLTGKSVYELAS